MPTLDRTRRWLHGGVRCWYHTAYRLPLVTLQSRTGMDPRRADSVVWHLTAQGILHADDIVEPVAASYADLARVHTPEWLDAIQDAATLARIFAVDASDVPVTQLLQTVRLATGGTVAAARSAIRTGRATVNLLGGFHHARPGGGGGFRAVNDVAVAVACLRAEGFKGQIAVLDLDAHPSDGTAACLADDARVWLGGLSGVDWGDLGADVDETVLAADAGDEAWLEALDGLLDRMPDAELTFVLAGADPLEGDEMGHLALSLDGLARRDRAVHKAIRGQAQVWLPAGGYTREAWRALASTVSLLATGRSVPVPADADPIAAHFAEVSEGLDAGALFGTKAVEGKDGGDWLGLTAEDMGLGGMVGPRLPRMLGAYTPEGVELALERFGLLDHVRRLGYHALTVELSTADVGDQLRVFGRHAGLGSDAPALLVEQVVERHVDDQGEAWLFVHWLRLQHPAARFREGRPRLPGQDAPGLGLVREVAEMHRRVALRLDLVGVMMRPSWLHIAYAVRRDFHFRSALAQGEFEALLRDLRHVPLVKLTHAVASGEVLKNGVPWKWAAAVMIDRLDDQELDAAAVAAARDQVAFSLS